MSEGKPNGKPSRVQNKTKEVNKMTNLTMKATLDNAKELGLTIQAIAGKNPKACKQIIYRGVEIQWSKYQVAEIKEVLEQLKCLETQEMVNEWVNGASASSCASMKVNTAWGRTDVDEIEHWLEQVRTYADGYKNKIQLVGQPLAKCIDLYMMYEKDSEVLKLEHFIETFKDINYKEKDLGLDKLKRMFAEKIIFVNDNTVFNRYGLEQFIKNWFGENDIKADKGQIRKIYNEVARVMGE